MRDLGKRVSSPLVFFPRGDIPGGVEEADPGKPGSLGRAGHGQHHPDGADCQPSHPGESRAAASPLGRGDAGCGTAGRRALPPASASEDCCRRADLSRWVPWASQPSALLPPRACGGSQQSKNVFLARLIRCNPCYLNEKGKN